MRHKRSYTAAQQQAIDAVDTNLQIIACAGSGKTQVISERIVNILSQKRKDGIRPENQVAFTFTERAARELEERVSTLYYQQFETFSGLSGIFIGTIHSFCLGLLKKYVPHYLAYELLDESRQRLFIDRHYQQSGMATLDMTRGIHTDQFISLMTLLQEATIDRELILDGRPWAALAEYNSLLKEHHYIDYSGILVETMRVLNDNPEIRAAIAQRVKYLTVDEYQDVNDQQEQLIRIFHELGANLCVVGDDDQNLYHWRGSDVAHIVHFGNRYANVQTVTLADNFRSTPALVSVAQSVIEQNETRLPKEMIGKSTRVTQDGDLMALEFSTVNAEAEWIAKKIIAMRGAAYVDHGVERGLTWSDFAILFRVRATAGPVIDALRRHGVPYCESGMSHLFGRPETEAVSKIFDFMAHTVTAEVVVESWLRADTGRTHADLQKGTDYLELMRRFDKSWPASHTSLQRVYLGFLSAILLREEDVPNGRGELLFSYLGRCSAVIDDYDVIHFKSSPQEKFDNFSRFLKSQQTRSFADSGSNVNFVVPDAVSLLTIHASKGLEFPAIFLPVLQAGRFPSSQRSARQWDYVPRGAIQNAEKYDGTVDDERRLFYVGLTRAETYLYATYAPDSKIKRYQRPSQFWHDVRAHPAVSRNESSSHSIRKSCPPMRRARQTGVTFSFSDLKYLLGCPYEFKLRSMYGFQTPIGEGIGYGQALHNVLAQIHTRAILGEPTDVEELPDLIDAHLHLPFATPSMRDKFRRGADVAMSTYVHEHSDDMEGIEGCEERVQLSLGDGIMVHGRLDLITQEPGGIRTITDFKTKEDVQPSWMTRSQLHIYAAGYEQQYGQPIDVIKVHDLETGLVDSEDVNPETLEKIRAAVVRAAERIQLNNFERIVTWGRKCNTCDFAGICRSQQRPFKSEQST